MEVILAKNIILWFCPVCQECGVIFYLGDITDKKLTNFELKMTHLSIHPTCEAEISDIISENRISVSQEEVFVLLKDFIKTRTGKFIVEWNCWNCGCGNLKPHYFQADELIPEKILKEVKSTKQKRNGCCLNEKSYINFITKENIQFFKTHPIVTSYPVH